MQSMSKLVNTEALESSLYNPPLDPKVLMLQEIMESTPIVDTRTTPRRPPLVTPGEVDVSLQAHVDSFNNLSLFNPYQGVIVNPTECLISPIRTDLQDFSIYLIGRFSDNGTWAAYKPEFDADCQDINEDLDQIEDHTDRLTNNLPSLAGIAQGAMALATVMNLLSNPCLGLDGFLGSIMDSGKALLNQIRAKISDMISQVKNAVNEAIGPIIDQIKAGIAQAKAAIAQMIAKAKEEVMKFAKAMLAQIRQGLADLMANLPQDPCLRGLLGSVATGAAAAVLGG
jgi:hypothetical protein